MNKVLKTIIDNKLIEKNQNIGVAVSGGIDSMCLVHFLNSIKDKLCFNIQVINIDHQIRVESKNDSSFVKEYCKQNNIAFHNFKVDAIKFSKDNKLTLEEGARKCRYNVFESLLKKKIVDKIALAHHQSDQIETVLLNLFRGTGLKGASGMEYEHDNFIRPFLDLQKSEILAYAEQNGIEYVVDKTNYDNNYSRNFLRNQIIPEIKTRWKNFEQNLINFSKICKQDDDYINSVISFDSLIYEPNLVKIPLSMFSYDNSITARIIKRAFEHLKAIKDIEAKHIRIIQTIAKESENGSKINLPNKTMCHKEYDYLTISKKQPKNQVKEQKFKIGSFKFNNTNIEVKSIRKLPVKKENCLFCDYDKLPKGIVWRTKKQGDVFEKFGGGTKKLKDYFIDKKIPIRLRNDIPLLCYENEVLLILGVEISDKIKITKNTKHIVLIKQK